jgi:hypothetical protein
LTLPEHAQRSKGEMGLRLLIFSLHIMGGGKTPPVPADIPPGRRWIWWTGGYGTLSPPGGLVVDPFFGSGTTAKVAISNGRKFSGSEIMSSYYESALEYVASD